MSIIKKVTCHPCGEDNGQTCICAIITEGTDVIGEPTAQLNDETGPIPGQKKNMSPGDCAESDKEDKIYQSKFDVAYAFSVKVTVRYRKDGGIYQATQGASCCSNC